MIKIRLFKAVNRPTSHQFFYKSSNFMNLEKIIFLKKPFLTQKTAYFEKFNNYL